MLAKPSLAGPLAALLAAAALLFSACSSSHPRDINWGTDAGLDFVPPDASTIDTSTSGVDGAIDSESATSSVSNDGGSQVDVSIDTNQ
jgi:hypothetical protein